MAADDDALTTLTLDFHKLQKVAACGEDVVPVVLQHNETLQILFVGFANLTALQTTLNERVAVLWSTSRNELWRKGATSGDVLQINEVRVNCEQNSLLYLVTPIGEGVCHTVGSNGHTRATCFYRTVVTDTTIEPVGQLW